MSGVTCAAAACGSVAVPAAETAAGGGDGGSVDASTADLGPLDATLLDAPAGDLPVAPAPPKPPGVLQFGAQNPGSLQGAYQFTGGATVEFSTKLDDKQGIASATLTDKATGAKVEVAMTGANTADVTIAGQKLTGKGKLTPAAAAALEAFGKSDLALASALAALELGCKVD